MVINLFRDSFAYAGDALEFAESSAGHRSCRTEMVQQRPLTTSSDPSDFVKRRSPQGLCPLGAMSADRKTMCLVTQPLQEVENRIARVERERRSARHKEALTPGIAVRALRYSDNCDVCDA